jgi:hypothetical protein
VRKYKQSSILFGISESSNAITTESIPTNLGIYTFVPNHVRKIVRNRKSSLIVPTSAPNLYIFQRQKSIHFLVRTLLLSIVISLFLSITNIILRSTSCLTETLSTIGLSLQRILDFVPVPNRVGSHDWLDLAKDVVDTSGNDEAREKVETVDVSCTDWDGSSDGTCETDDVDEYTAEIGYPAAPLDTVDAVVWARCVGVVEVGEFEISFADEVAGIC